MSTSPRPFHEQLAENLTDKAAHHAESAAFQRQAAAQRAHDERLRQERLLSAAERRELQLAKESARKRQLAEVIRGYAAETAATLLANGYAPNIVVAGPRQGQLGAVSLMGALGLGRLANKRIWCMSRSDVLFSATSARTPYGRGEMTDHRTTAYRDCTGLDARGGLLDFKEILGIHAYTETLSSSCSEDSGWRAKISSGRTAVQKREHAGAYLSDEELVSYINMDELDPENQAAVLFWRERLLNINPLETP